MIYFFCRRTAEWVLIKIYGTFTWTLIVVVQLNEKENGTRNKEEKIVGFDCLEGGRIKSSVVNAILHSIRAKKIGPHMLQWDFKFNLNSVTFKDLVTMAVPRNDFAIKDANDFFPFCYQTCANEWLVSNGSKKWNSCVLSDDNDKLTNQTADPSFPMLCCNFA